MKIRVELQKKTGEVLRAYDLDVDENRWEFWQEVEKNVTEAWRGKGDHRVVITRKDGALMDELLRELDDARTRLGEIVERIRDLDLKG